MQRHETQVRAFTSSYEQLSKVLANKVRIGTAFDLSASPTSPTSTEFTAIWDTGATSTVISRKVADNCGLKPISRAKVFTASGEDTTFVYFVSISLPNGVVFPQLHVTEGKIAGDAEILIGMDIISKGDFAVTNWNGKTVFTYRMPSLERIDFVKQQPMTVLNESGRPTHKVGRNDPCPCGSGKKYKRCCGR